MKKIILTLSLFALPIAVHAADNALSQTELMSITQKALDAYSAANPMLVTKIAGFKTSTIGQDGKVVISVNHDGMAMQGTYSCIRQTDNTFVCSGQ